MHWRASLARRTLEQVRDQIPFGVSQIGTVGGNIFAPMRCRVAIALGRLGRRHGHFAFRLEPYDALCSQGTSDGGVTHAHATAVMQLVGNLLQTGLHALLHDLVQDCDMLRPQCWRPAANVDRRGSAPSSGCFVAMARSFHPDSMPRLRRGFCLHPLSHKFPRGEALNKVAAVLHAHPAKTLPPKG